MDDSFYSILWSGLLLGRSSYKDEKFVKVDVSKSS